MSRRPRLLARTPTLLHCPLLLQAPAAISVTAPAPATFAACVGGLDSASHCALCAILE